MNGAVLGSVVSLGIFIAGLIYHAGQMAQRVTALEQWRTELRAELQKFDQKLDNIEALIRGTAD